MSDTTYRVTGIGNAIVDVLTLADDAFLKAESLEKGAMTLVSERRALELYEGMSEKVHGAASIRTGIWRRKRTTWSDVFTPIGSPSPCPSTR